ncbi:uncharacterized protein LOC142973818 [Anticarsia gemmatalis]|uniref:uncharacterized protein LOC142973818 n=1 Tax=Anticarsia gemmatalis TaxID=129554 RepID=UPI003F7762B0
MEIHKLRVVDFTSPISQTEGESTLYKKREDSKNVRNQVPVHEVRFVERGGGDQSATTSGSALGVDTPKRSIFNKRATSSRIKTQSKSRKRDPPNVLRLDDGKKYSKNDDSSDRRSRLNFFTKDSIFNFRGTDNKRKTRRGKSKDHNSREKHNSVSRASRKVERSEYDNKKIPEDIYGFNRSNRSINPCLYPMSCAYLDVDHSAFKKLTKKFRNKQQKQQIQLTHKKKPQSHITKVDLQQQKHEFQRQNEPPPEHQQIKILSMSSLRSWQKNNSSMIYYNLIDGLRSQGGRKSSKVTYEADKKHSLGSKPVNVDQSVAVSPSSLSPISKCRNDAACGPSLEKVSERTVSPCPVIQKTSTPKSSAPSCFVLRKPQIIKQKSSELGSKHSNMMAGLPQGVTAYNVESKNKTPKNCLRNAFLGLLIIVWSPCLLAVILAWVLMSPGRATKSLDTDPSKKASGMTSFINKIRKKCSVYEYQQTSATQSRPQQKRFFPSVTSWYARIANTAATSFDAVRSLLKLKSTCAASTFISLKSNTKNRSNANNTVNNTRNSMLKPTTCNTMRCEYTTQLCPNDHNELKPKSTKYEREPIHPCKDNRSEFVYSYQLPLGSNILNKDCSYVPKSQHQPLSIKKFQDQKLSGNPNACGRKPEIFDFLLSKQLSPMSTSCSKPKPITICKNQKHPRQEVACSPMASVLYIDPKKKCAPACLPPKKKKKKIVKENKCINCPCSPTKLEQKSIFSKLAIPAKVCAAKETIILNNNNAKPNSSICLPIKTKECRKKRMQRHLLACVPAAKPLYKKFKNRKTKLFQSCPCLPSKPECVPVKPEPMIKPPIMCVPKPKPEPVLRLQPSPCRCSHSQDRKKPSTRKAPRRKKKKKKRKPKKKKTSGPSFFARIFYSKCMAKCNDVDKEMNPVPFNGCRCAFIHTLRNRPCLWIYNLCPCMYPVFINCLRFQSNCFRAITFCCCSIFCGPALYLLSIIVECIFWTIGC